MQHWCRPSGRRSRACVREFLAGSAGVVDAKGRADTFSFNAMQTRLSWGQKPGVCPIKLSTPGRVVFVSFSMIFGSLQPLCCVVSGVVGCGSGAGRLGVKYSASVFLHRCRRRTHEKRNSACSCPGLHIAAPDGLFQCISGLSRPRPRIYTEAFRDACGLALLDGLPRVKDESGRAGDGQCVFLLGAVGAGLVCCGAYSMARSQCGKF